MVNKIVYKNPSDGNIMIESIDPRQPTSVYLNIFPGSIIVNTYTFPTDSGSYISAFKLCPTPFQKVELATDVLLPNTPSYSSGVLTSTGDPGTLSIDSVVATMGNRILVKNQGTENGIYTVTDDGASPGPNWSLTRATDFVQIMTPLYTGSKISVNSGTVNTGNYYTIDSQIDTIDTDAVTFTLGPVLTTFESVKYATDSTLPDTPSYSAGILASTGDPGTLSIDSTLVTVGQRILVKDQVTTTQNGIYTVTDDGAGPGPNWELTRSVDFVAPMYANSSILVDSSGLSFKLDTQIDTIDTDAVTFTEVPCPIIVYMPVAREIRKTNLRNERSSMFSRLDQLYIEAKSQGRDASTIETRQQYLRDITDDATIASSVNGTDLNALTISGWTEPNISSEPMCDFKRTEVDTATYTILDTDHVIGVIHNSAVTLTLPEISSICTKKYYIKDELGNVGTNNITINTSGSDTIDGTSSYVLGTNYGSVTLYNNTSTGWFILG
jgi:hypothetical protein